MGSASLFSDSWYRVEKLKPRLRKHTEIHRHHYRDKIWYVLQDHVSGKFHRFAPDAYYLIQLMDGTHTVSDIWMMASKRLDRDHLPTQDDVIQLLSRLHNADVILGGVSPDSEEMAERQETLRKKKVRSYFINPLGIRFPLIDPEQWLDHMQGLARVIFHPLTGFLWLLLVGSALLLALQHWTMLSDNVADRVLSAENLVLLWFVYPLVKLLHEMGHALATKRWGGEVHEMGVMLMMLVPIPYVDVSDAHSFRNKSQRLVVGAAGVGVELALAAVSLWFWVYAEPGVGRAIAYNIMLIAGVSTLLFNLNPLLRFDGYHMLVDFLEIPNLGQRSNKYLGYLVKQYLFRAKNLQSPVSAPGERFWFIFYSLASFVYRMFILYIIVLFIAGKYFFIGVMLAIWAFVMMLVLPAFKTVRAAWVDSALNDTRTRGMTLCGALVFLFCISLALIPAPSSTLAEGVVWVPEEMWVRAGSNGFVTEVVAKENSYVQKGEVLIRCKAPELDTQRRVIDARIRELRVRRTSVLSDDRMQANLIQEEIKQTEAQRDYIDENITRLTIRSPMAGRFLLRDPENMTGRFVRRGEMLAYVVQPDQVGVRAVVMPEQIEQVREQTQHVELRLIDDFDVIHETTLQHEVPAAIHILPSLALAVEGGGNIALDPSSKGEPKAFKSLFQVDVSLPAEVKASHMGSRAYVLFVHNNEPLLWQWYRQLRQTFLSVLHV